MAKEQPAGAAGWQSIETAPRDGQAILVTDGWDCYCVEWDEEFDWWTVDDNKLGPFRLRGSAPTHWMPLPPVPGPADGEQMSATTFRWEQDGAGGDHGTATYFPGMPHEISLRVETFAEAHELERCIGYALNQQRWDARAGLLADIARIKP